MMVRYLLLSGFLVGCAPSIQSFSVTPQVVCGDQSVWVRYRAHGNSAIRETVDPQPEGFSVETYTLVVINEDRAPADSDLACNVYSLPAGKPAACGQSVLQVRQVKRIRNGATLRHGDRARLAGDSLVVDFRLDSSSASTNSHVAGVTTSLRRRLTVSHDGRVAAIADSGIVSHELDGSTPIGAWHIATALSSTEKADSGLRPTALTVLYSPVCDGSRQ